MWSPICSFLRNSSGTLILCWTRFLLLVKIFKKITKLGGFHFLFNKFTHDFAVFQQTSTSNRDCVKKKCVALLPLFVQVNKWYFFPSVVFVVEVSVLHFIAAPYSLHLNIDTMCSAFTLGSIQFSWLNVNNYLNIWDKSERCTLKSKQHVCYDVGNFIWSGSWCVFVIWSV